MNTLLLCIIEVMYYWDSDVELMTLYRADTYASEYTRKPADSIANQYGKININGRPQSILVTYNFSDIIFAAEREMHSSGDYAIMAFTLLRELYLIL